MVGVEEGQNEGQNNDKFVETSEFEAAIFRGFFLSIIYLKDEVLEESDK
jgi:hypothetical protein